MCVSCFENGDHENHDYIMYKSSFGGCCDCGNPEAWKPEGFFLIKFFYQPLKLNFFFSFRRNCRNHPGRSDLNPLDCVKGDPVLGEGRACRIVIKYLVILLMRHITLTKKQKQLPGGDAPIGELPIDYYLLKFEGKEISEFLYEFAAYGDSVRRMIGQSLIKYCIGVISDKDRLFKEITINIDDPEPIMQFIPRVETREPLVEEKNIDYSLLKGLSASLPICDSLINLYLQVRFVFFSSLIYKQFSDNQKNYGKTVIV